MDDLLSGKCDLAIAGGSHTFTCVPLLMVFSTLNALSHGSQIRPFDAGPTARCPAKASASSCSSGAPTPSATATASTP